MSGKNGRNTEKKIIDNRIDEETEYICFPIEKIFHETTLLFKRNENNLSSACPKCNATNSSSFSTDFFLCEFTCQVSWMFLSICET